MRSCCVDLRTHTHKTWWTYWLFNRTLWCECVCSCVSVSAWARVYCVFIACVRSRVPGPVTPEHTVDGGLAANCTTLGDSLVHVCSLMFRGVWSSFLRSVRDVIKGRARVSHVPKISWTSKNAPKLTDHTARQWPLTYATFFSQAHGALRFIQLHWRPVEFFQLCKYNAHLNTLSLLLLSPNTLREIRTCQTNVPKPIRRIVRDNREMSTKSGRGRKTRARERGSARRQKARTVVGHLMGQHPSSQSIILYLSDWYVCVCVRASVCVCHHHRIHHHRVQTSRTDNDACTSMRVSAFERPQDYNLCTKCTCRLRTDK